MAAPPGHDDQATASGYKEYRWSVLVAVILSVATLSSAWCGFQASSWSSLYAHESRAANGERFEAARQVIEDVLAQYREEDHAARRGDEIPF